MVKISISNLNIWFGETLVLKDLTLDVFANEVLSIIGPSNSGKTSFLRSINRLNDLDDRHRMSGTILLDSKDVKSRMQPEDLRKKVGMIFALPIPLPLSIYDNLAYGPRMAGTTDKRKLDSIVEESLRAAFLWDEVKDRLKTLALKLSGGQQQRLCIARTLALNPDVILFDEPCSGLDPISTAKVEETISVLKKEKTIILVTNNTKQAARVGTRTAFFLMGELVEIDRTETIFTAPGDKRTNDYVTGRFG